MKVLLSFAGGAGHLNPCLPLVRALQTAGWLAAIGGQRDVIDGCPEFDAHFRMETHRRLPELSAQRALWCALISIANSR